MLNAPSSARSEPDAGQRDAKPPGPNRSQGSQNRATRTLRIATVVGARPQFIKAAVVSRAIAAFRAPNSGLNCEELLIHTGQHYDDRLSQVFFDELRIPRPAVNLGIGSGPHGRQTGRMLERLEACFQELRPDRVLVYGDTNSTLAAALAAVKLHIPVAHVEAGLRSFNPRMPEEINRVLTDGVSTLLFCPTQTAVDNLAREDITRGVHLVGDVMLESLQHNLALAERTSDVLDRLNLLPGGYDLATVHRAENTDDPERLDAIFSTLSSLPRDVVVPLHPRTRNCLPPQFHHAGGRLRLIEPVSYLDMVLLQKHARIVLTDSGGMQKEAYWLGRPCVTLRDETEWTELIETGWNRLAGADPQSIRDAVAAFDDVPPSRRLPPVKEAAGVGATISALLAGTCELPDGFG